MHDTPVAVDEKESICVSQKENDEFYTLHGTQIYEPIDVTVAVDVVVVVVVKREEVPRKEGSCSYGGALCTGRRGSTASPPLPPDCRKLLKNLRTCKSRKNCHKAEREFNRT